MPSKALSLPTTAPVGQLVYLVQGFFFHKDLIPGIAYGREGAVAVVRDATTRSMFSGVIGPGVRPGELIGRMSDFHGEASISDVLLTERSFRFRKQYDLRTTTIRYRFTKSPNGSWGGTFRGEGVGTGLAWCIVTPMSEQCLLPPGKLKGAK